MKTEITGCIYRYFNVKTEMSYVGQSVHLKRRRRYHETTNSNDYFHNSIRKCGIDAFKFEILENGIPRSKLNKHEKFWIKRFDCVFPNGYNFTTGGHSTVFSEASRKKISEAKKGRPLSPEHREKISEVRKGKKLSPEHREKLSKAMKGIKRKPLSPKHRRKISESLKAKHATSTNNPVGQT